MILDAGKNIYYASALLLLLTPGTQSSTLSFPSEIGSKDLSFCFSGRIVGLKIGRELGPAEAQF